jgi:hypothetical protein
MPRATLSIVFSEDCWRFLAAHIDADPTAIGHELRTALQQPPRLQTAPPDPTPRYALDLQRLQVYELLDFMARMHEALRKDDERRGLAERCLRAIGAAIIRNREAYRRGRS